MSGSELLLAVRLLIRRKTRQRIEVATSVQSFLEFELDASDADVWNRLGREIPAWSHSGVVPSPNPVALNLCRTALDPVNPVDDGRREAARRAIRSILDDLYLVLITSDRIDRVYRDLRHPWRVTRILRNLGLPVRSSVRFQAELERIAVASASGDNRSADGVTPRLLEP